MSSVRATVPISNLLPADIRRMLVEASRVANERQRAVKIDEAYYHARCKYPSLFKAE